MKDKIFQTIKISGAAMAAICLASLLGLVHPVSAGIIAILTIQPTKKETLETAAGRLAAFVAALVIFGFCRLFPWDQMTAFMCYLILYIFVCIRFRWHSAMAMNSVLISHFLTWDRMDAAAVGNEVLLFVTGVSMGVFANMHLHKKTEDMEVLRKKTDEGIRHILFRMSERILDREITDYDGSCFRELKAHIRSASLLAEENYKNQLGTSDVYDMEYIEMRNRQYYVLYEMYKMVRFLETTPITAERIAVFFRRISEEYHKENTCGRLLQDFYILDQSMKELPLPKDREEFEDRARLFGMLRFMEEFITIKVEFIEKTVGKKVK